jgi:DNA repair exonuclease SbcCD ATPase subunit
VIAAVAGLVIIAARHIYVSREENKAKLKKLAQIEEDQKLRQPIQEIQKTMEEASEEADRVEEKAMEFLGQYHIFCVSSDARSGIFELRSQIHEYERLKARDEKSKLVREEYEEIHQSLLSFARDLGTDLGEDIATGLGRMQMRAAEYRLAQESCEQAAQKKEDFRKENNIEELAGIEKCPYSLDELNSMIYDVDDRMEDVREAIEQYNHQMDDLQEQLDQRDEKEQQLAVCRQQQKEESHAYEVLSLTREFLQTAKDQFSARYLGPIENGFGKYYEFLTGDRSGDWMVDANISVKMKEQGQLRETKWLSAGYQDLLGICMRLALVDAMYPAEKPFLVLDDPFVNLDEDKMEHGTKLLKQISREYQILYFTCHESREML